MKNTKIAIIAIAIALGTIITMKPTTANAKVTKYLTKSKDITDNTFYEYDLTDLNKSFMNYKVDANSINAKLYNDFITRGTMVAVFDDENGYVDYKALCNNYMDTIANNEKFDMNSYTELAPSSDMLKTLPKDICDIIPDENYGIAYSPSSPVQINNDYTITSSLVTPVSIGTTSFTLTSSHVTSDSMMNSITLKDQKGNIINTTKSRIDTKNVKITLNGSKFAYDSIYDLSLGKKIIEFSTQTTTKFTKNDTIPLINLGNGDYVPHDGYISDLDERFASLNTYGKNYSSYWQMVMALRNLGIGAISQDTVKSMFVGKIVDKYKIVNMRIFYTAFPMQDIDSDVQNIIIPNLYNTSFTGMKFDQSIVEMNVKDMKTIYAYRLVFQLVPVN